MLTLHKVCECYETDQNQYYAVLTQRRALAERTDEQIRLSRKKKTREDVVFERRSERNKNNKKEVNTR